MPSHPSKRSQPFRRKKRRPKGASLNAMKRGKPATMRNPASINRSAQRKKRRRNPLYSAFGVRR